MKRFIVRLYATVVVDAVDKGDAYNRASFRLGEADIKGFTHKFLEIDEIPPYGEKSG